MKIGIHADPAGHQIPGGVGIYVRRLVEALLSSDDGNDYRLLVAQQLREFALGPGSAPVVAAGFPLKFLYAGWNWLNLPHVKVGLDLVHATGLVIPAARGAGLVATIHDLAVEEMPEVVPRFWRQLYRRGLRLVLRDARIICTVTEAVKRRLVDAYGVDSNRIVVTPEAPAMLPAHPRSRGVIQRLGLEGPFILNVGTLEPRKNQAMLVRAFASVKDKLPQWRLVIAGSAGWGSSEVLEQIRNSKVEDRVVVTGAMEDAGLAALYGKASLFAFPSLYEGFGLPLIEALAFGLPAVASTDPALKEVGGGAAIYVPASDDEAWAQALVQTATDEALRERLIQAGPLRASGFSWDKTAEATREAYQLAGQKGRT